MCHKRASHKDYTGISNIIKIELHWDFLATKRAHHLIKHTHILLTSHMERHYSDTSNYSKHDL